MLIWVLAFTISYLSGVSLYERFGDLDRQFDGKIQALFFAVVAPLALAGLFSFRIWNSDSRFNEPVSPLMLEDLNKY